MIQIKLKMVDSTRVNSYEIPLDSFNLNNIVFLRPNKDASMAQVRDLYTLLEWESSSSGTRFIILPHWCDVLELAENGVPEEEWLVQPNLP